MSWTVIVIATLPSGFASPNARSPIMRIVGSGPLNWPGKSMSMSIDSCSDFIAPFATW